MGAIVTNWDNMAIIWYHVICNEFHVVPKEHPVFLSKTYLSKCWAAQFTDKFSLYPCMHAQPTCITLTHEHCPSHIIIVVVAWCIRDILSKYDWSMHQLTCWCNQFCTIHDSPDLAICFAHLICTNLLWVQAVYPWELKQTTTMHLITCQEEDLCWPLGCTNLNLKHQLYTTYIQFSCTCMLCIVFPWQWTIICNLLNLSHINSLLPVKHTSCVLWHKGSINGTAPLPCTYCTNQ